MPLCVRRSFPVLCVMFVAFAARAAHAAPKSDATFYESKVRPILEDHCFDCHGEDKQKNKLRLDSAVGILRGGESGEPLLVRGVSAESYIIKRVTSANAKEVMPPKGNA